MSVQKEEVFSQDTLQEIIETEVEIHLDVFWGWIDLSGGDTYEAVICLWGASLQADFESIDLNAMNRKDRDWVFMEKTFTECWHQVFEQENEDWIDYEVELSGLVKLCIIHRQLGEKK